MDAQQRVRLFRLAAALLLGMAVVGVAIRLAADPHPVPVAAPAAAKPPSDVLKYILVRCNELGGKAVNEATCRAAWAKNRRRFLRKPPKPASPEQPAKPLSTMGPR